MGRFEKGRRETSNSESEPQQPRTFTAAQAFFFARLERLLRLQQEYEALLRPDDWEGTLLHKAIYSTYCDCVQLGVGHEARERLSQRHHRSELPEGK